MRLTVRHGPLDAPILQKNPILSAKTCDNLSTVTASSFHALNMRFLRRDGCRMIDLEQKRINPRELHERTFGGGRVGRVEH